MGRIGWIALIGFIGLIGLIGPVFLMPLGLLRICHAILSLQNQQLDGLDYLYHFIYQPTYSPTQSP